MRVELISPEKQIFASNEIILVQLPGVDGLFEILNHHASLVALLTKGKIKIKDSQNKVSYFEINKGVVEVKNNVITILFQ